MAVTSMAIGATEPDLDAINLRRLLLRLEQQILLPDPSSTLLYSSFERDKVAKNLEYARTLLLRLQHHAPASKAQSRKQAQQAELTRQRALIKRLTKKLYDLRRQGDASDYDDQSEGEGEDLLAEYFAPESSTAKPTPPPDSAPIAAHTVSTPATATATASAGLRSRMPQNATTGANVFTSKAPTTALPSDLFGKPGPRASASQASPFRSAPDELSTEKQLEYQEATQAELTSSLVTLAQQLKASSLAFAQDLALDAESVSKTEGALGKNQEGLTSASKRMGVLRKMTEGRWWWQRYIMFILIAVLWVAEIGIVFFGPKLRF